MARFPQHLMNVPTGRCAHCRCVALLPWAFGEQQGQRLCDVCGDRRWRKMLLNTGRLGEWDRMLAGRR